MARHKAINRLKFEDRPAIDQKVEIVRLAEVVKRHIDRNFSNRIPSIDCAISA